MLNFFKAKKAGSTATFVPEFGQVDCNTNDFRCRESRILSTLFLQILKCQGLTQQIQMWNALVSFGLTLVLSGHLGLFGIILSTISAQSANRPDPWFAANALSTQRRPKRTSRRTTPADEELPSGEPRPAASYARYSSQMQSETSIQDQQRRCQEAAQQHGLHIAAELQFADSAVSGTKLDRDGLNAMLASAKQGSFRTLFFYSLSRLARESVISMLLLKELVHLHRVRIISVTEGIDSDRDGWQMVATIFSMLAEHYIRDLSYNVFKGQEARPAHIKLE